MITGPRNELERRALSEGTDSAGGFTVPDILMARWIDRLRTALVIVRAGAVTVPLTSDSVKIARLLADPTAAWRSENAAVAESDPTFEAVTFAPKSLDVFTKVSRELLEDSVNITEMLETAFVRSFAVEVDRVCLYGTGTPWVKPRPCRGCGVELGHGVGNSTYCADCRAQQCPECRTFGGRHGAKCRYDVRRRRPGLTEYHGVVTEQDIVNVYLEHGRKAVRIARSICGNLEAEDVVHDLTLYLLEKRDYLRFPPTANYFLRAAQHGALRKRLYAWARFTVAMDPEDLLLAERAMARPGRPIETRVRLPEPVVSGRQ
jgi:hypothetical protein